MISVTVVGGTENCWLRAGQSCIKPAHKLSSSLLLFMEVKCMLLEGFGFGVWKTRSFCTYLNEHDCKPMSVYSWDIDCYHILLKICVNIMHGEDCVQCLNQTNLSIQQTGIKIT